MNASCAFSHCPRQEHAKTPHRLCASKHSGPRDVPPLTRADALATSQNQVTARANRLLLMGSANTAGGSGHRRIRAAVSGGHQAPLTLALSGPCRPDRNDGLSRVVDLSMTTWGFIGSGNIGTTVARLAIE